MSEHEICLDLPRIATPVTRFVSPRERPEAYPGTRPGWSWLFTGRTIVPFSPSADPAALAGRTAVLAVGSNGCPRRLADPDKFGGRPDLAIPVLAGWVDDVVSVHLARRTTYGSVPASVAACPGARSRLFATLLTEAELERLGGSEGGDYELIELSGALSTEDGLEVGPLRAYWAARGLADAETGDPVRLRAFPAEGCPWRAMDQVEAQRALAAGARAVAIPRPAAGD